MITRLFADISEQDLMKIVDEHYAHWSYYNPHMVKSVSFSKFKNLYSGRKLPLGIALYEGMNIVGFCVLKEKNIKGRSEGPWITDALILEKYRRKYYGTKLVEAAINKLRELGYHEVYVWTDQASLFCRKLGFEYVGTTIKDQSGEGEIYTKKIGRFNW